MDSDRLLYLIDIVFQEIDNVVLDYKQFKDEEEPIVSAVKTLVLLKKEVENNPHEINKIILRSMRDVGISAYKYFENTSLGKAIDDLTEFLYKEVIEYQIIVL
jgi:hypothetical protein